MSSVCKFLTDSSYVDSQILRKQKINIEYIVYGFVISRRFTETLLLVLWYRLLASRPT